MRFYRTEARADPFVVTAQPMYRTYEVESLETLKPVEYASVWYGVDYPPYQSKLPPIWYPVGWRL